MTSPTPLGSRLSVKNATVTGALPAIQKYLSTATSRPPARGAGGGRDGWGGGQSRGESTHASRIGKPCFSRRLGLGEDGVLGLRTLRIGAPGAGGGDREEDTPLA